MTAPKENPDDQKDQLPTLTSLHRRPPYEHHLLISSDNSHNLLTEALVTNPNEIRDELDNAMGSLGRRATWMPQEEDEEYSSDEEHGPNEFDGGFHGDPNSPINLEAGHLNFITRERDENLANTSSRQEKISSFVMGVSLRIAGTSRPAIEGRRSSIRVQRLQEASIDGRTSHDGNLSRIISYPRSVRTVQSSLGSPLHLAPHNIAIQSIPPSHEANATSPINIASFTDEPIKLDYSHYLYGNSLMIFSPQSKIRRACYKVVSNKYMSPFILLMLFIQTTFLAFRQWNPHSPDGYIHHGITWADWVIVGINSIYTIEIIMKIISFGLINDKVIFETLGLPYHKSKISYGVSYVWTQLNRNILIFRSKTSKSKRPNTKASASKSSSGTNSDSGSIFAKYGLERGDVELLNLSKPSGSEKFDSAKGTTATTEKRISILSEDEEDANENEVPLADLWELDAKLSLMNVNRAYLRKNGQRLDFASVLCFWISIPLSITGWDRRTGFMLFRSLGQIRILRLCNLTHGTNVILHMFQAALPQLIDVGIFISCFWVIFGIIGVQSFLMSFSRNCLWSNPNNPEEQYLNTKQYCGSYLTSNGTRLPFLERDGAISLYVKGYECPINSVCQSGANPYNGTVSFDNFFQSMQLVFVIMSINTFAELMYSMMDSDGILASLFFIFGIFILTVWLMNLFIAIIVTSFHAAHEAAAKHRREPKENAFSKMWPLSSKFNAGRNQALISKLPLLKLYYRFEICFILLVFADLIVQCWRTYGMSASRASFLYRLEVIFTCVFLGEILLRFALHLPYWRAFFSSKKNLFDLFLAIFTSIIIIGPVKRKLGQAYYWLTVFQLLRFYRVVLAFRWTGDLLLRIMRNIKAILDLALFFFILLGLCGIIIGRFFEGTVPELDLEDVIYTMHTLPNTLMSLYVITSTAGWANIMYNLQKYARSTIQRAVGSILLILWFIVSNFVVLNIFIAIIEHALSESLEGQKRHQLKKFITDMTKKLLTVRSTPGYLRRLKEKIFKRNEDKAIDTTVTHLLLAGAAVNEFVDSEMVSHKSRSIASIKEEHRSDYHIVRLFNLIGNFLKKPFNNPFYAAKIKIPESENFDPTEYATQILKDRKNLAQRQDEYLKRHPTFNYTFFILSPQHPIRRLCQKIVKLSYGERIDGVEPNVIVNDIFSVIMFCASVSVVVVACYLTPIRRRDLLFNSGVWNWGIIVDFSFLIIFGLEIILKVTADGVFYTPNAYVRSPWNWLDFVAFASILIEFIAFVLFDGKLSRVIRGLKALRALRLLTISETAKNNFHYTMISGFWKILSAAMVAVSLLFPFSIWGLNVFNGRLGHCNEHEFSEAQCINEYESELYEWLVLSPTVYLTPALSMNNFKTSFSTFYQITSLEGWPELLQDVMKSTGIGTPQHQFASPFNGFLIILFNFVSTVFILTLFVSVIISNYSKLTGRAYLTPTQIQWYHVKKYLSRVKPSLRRDVTQMNRFKKFCYKMTVGKNRVWRSILNMALFIHIIDLLVEAFPVVANIVIRYGIFVFTTFCFAMDSLMRLIGIGYKEFFKNVWNTVALLIGWAAFITTSVAFMIDIDSVYYNLNKLFLIAMLLYLFPRSDRLNQLLTFASAAFPSLLSMMFTWLIFFLVYGIAMNQIFGLTKFGNMTNSNMNFRTIPKALILLFRMSFGEEWNIIMQDFVLEPPFCTPNISYEDTDCGSKPYAYILFMSWNIISMYIMLSLFISLILDTFSYIAGGSKYAHLINRNEVRKFKKAWQKYDPWGSGFICVEDLPNFVREIKGSLEVAHFKETDKEETINHLSKKWFRKTDSDSPYDVAVDHDAIEAYMSRNMDKNNYLIREQFIEEAKLRMELQDESGISFKNIILQIPFYSSFDADECLILSDFLEQRLFRKRLEERLRRTHAYNMLIGFTCRWKYSQYKQGKILKEEFLAKVKQ